MLTTLLIIAGIILALVIICAIALFRILYLISKIFEE